MRFSIRVLATCLTCLVAVPADCAELFWNDAAGIHGGDLQGAERPKLLYETFETRGLAVSEATDRLMWSDVLPLGALGPAGVIRSGSTQGGDVASVVSYLPQPAGVAIDDRHGKIYWTDLGDANNPSTVYAANLDGSEAKPLIRAAWLSDIAGIALDDMHDQLYFSYVNPLIDAIYTGGIARADLDGGNLAPVVGGLGEPIGVAVDPTGGNLFWADAWKPSMIGGLGEGNGRIETATLEGKNQRTILGGLDSPYGVALDIGGGDVYWTNAGAGSIQRTSMSGALPYVEDVVTGLKDPTALAIADSSISFSPGDANGDGLVDREDAAILARNLGRSGEGVTWTDGDFDRDGLVGLTDLAIVSSHFTLTQSRSVMPSQVPEPGTAALLAFAIGAIAGDRLRRSKGRGRRL
jgi:hypothetical protein